MRTGAFPGNHEGSEHFCTNLLTERAVGRPPPLSKTCSAMYSSTRFPIKSWHGQFKFALMSCRTVWYAIAFAISQGGSCPSCTSTESKAGEVIEDQAACFAGGGLHAKQLTLLPTTHGHVP